MFQNGICALKYRPIHDVKPASLSSAAQKSEYILIYLAFAIYSGILKNLAILKEPLTSNKLNAHISVGETYVRWG